AVGLYFAGLAGAPEVQHLVGVVAPQVNDDAGRGGDDRRRPLPHEVAHGNRQRVGSGATHGVELGVLEVRGGDVAGDRAVGVSLDGDAGSLGGVDLDVGERRGRREAQALGGDGWYGRGLPRQGDVEV